MILAQYRFSSILQGMKLEWIACHTHCIYRVPPSCELEDAWRGSTYKGIFSTSRAHVKEPSGELPRCHEVSSRKQNLPHTEYIGMAPLGDCFAPGLWGREVLPSRISQLSFLEGRSDHGQSPCHLCGAARCDLPIAFLDVQSFLVNWDREVHFWLWHRKWISIL